MPQGRKISEKIKMKARDKYLRDAQVVDICRDLKITPPVMYRWMREEGWRELKKEAMETAITQIKPDVIAHYSRLEIDSMDIYNEIVKKAKDAFDDNDIKTAEAAFDILNKALLNRRAIGSGMMHLKFLNDIATVLKNRIRDKDLLTSIIDDIRAIHIKDNE